MSQAKLTLRPPPNIDYVQGYPGIPPGAPDRPQAAVKGAIEVRVGQQGVKAKWVRIELRKVETLPGGGLANTFFDFVGQSPISVWQANHDDYATLHTQDFQFFIRIPEAIPPSISLERGAGIKYELIATICLKGKKGLLRRDKPTIVATASPIIIDKHELHSTWPVYQQPETRTHTHDGVTLTVDRSHTCYGPGDRIVVMATVKPDSLNTTILRGFEFTLRETMVFKAGPHTSGKRGAPQVKVASIGEQKVPVNVTLYPGNHHKAELTVVIPSHHTSATLNAARHIDITYVLIVKALMGTGQPVVMELPIVVSNWPRSVSVEATRRIGLAPNVSLPGQHPAPRPARDVVASSSIAQPIVPTQVQTISARPSVPSMTTSENSGTTVGNGRAVGQYNTVPASSTNGYANKPGEFGQNRPQEPARAASSDHGSRDGHGNSQTSAHSGGAIGPLVSPAAAARPRHNSRAMSSSISRPLTVANVNEQDVEEATAAAQRQASLSATTSRPVRAATQPTPQASRAQWVSAEDEKRRLYEAAVANVERVQGRSRSSIEHEQTSSARTPSPSPQQSVHASPVNKAAWPTAEEEKARLFNQAQAAVARTHGLDSSSMSPSSSSHARGGSLTASQSGVSSSAALYPEAMSSMQRHASAGSSAVSQQITPVKKPGSSYPSAEEEKAALRRYHEAKAAVDRTQGAAYGTSSVSNPISYDALYPVPSPPAPAASELPPAFPPSSSQSSQPSYLSEKEKLRRAYEAQDAAALASSPPPPPNAARLSAVGPLGFNSASQPHPPPSPSPPQGYMSPIAEKEMLRRRFEAQDTAAQGAAAPSPPPRAPIATPPRASSGSPRAPSGSPRAPPPTPGYGASGSRPLTAAEEKARLQAMYAAEDKGSPLGVTSSPYTPISNGTNGYHAAIPAPPPLAPRPPKEYIQETQEEDLRTYAKLEAIDKMKTELVLSGLVDQHGNHLSSLSGGKMLIE